MTRLTKGKEESSFQNTIIEYAHLKGWRVAHFRKSQNIDGRWFTPVGADGQGWPDLVLVRDRLIFAEVKADRGKLTTDQQIWITMLYDIGEEVYIWRPRDWESIEKVLK